MSTSGSSLMNNKNMRNWAELPPELTLEIVSRVGAVDILLNAQRVCKSWYHICKDPYMWRMIDMSNFEVFGDAEYSDMCSQAVDRSQGDLVEIEIWNFGNDELLHYISDRSSNLRILRLRMSYEMTDEGFMEAVKKLPLLEYLEVSQCSLSGKSLRFVGKSCPNLEILKLNSDHSTFYFFKDEEFKNEDAFAIAQSMPKLFHLELYGNFLTNSGLKTILDGCPELEYLELRCCFNLDLTGDLEKRCIERMIELKRPNDYDPNSGKRFCEFL